MKRALGRTSERAPTSPAAPLGLEGSSSIAERGPGRLLSGARVGLTLALLAQGCAAARLVSPPTPVPADPGTPRVVVLEPFFEQANWKVTTRSETADVQGYYGSQRITFSREVADKPVYARIASLSVEHQLTLAEVQRLRPSWRVTSTSGLPVVEGPVSLVRVVVGDVDTVDSNRTLMTAAFAFGILVPPLLLVQINKVVETQRVLGSVTRFEAQAADVRAKLLRYPSQPDYAVDTRGFSPLTRQFGLDVAFEEGVLATEEKRDPVLVTGFSAKLAAAVVAIVEEQR